MVENNIEKLIHRCEEELADIDDLEKREEQKENIRQLWLKYRGEDEVISSDKYQELLAKDAKKKQLKIYTHIPKLDEIIEGFREGNLVVISGATKEGKTSISQTFTENFEEKCLWFTYEVPVSEFLEKFTKIPLFYLPKTLKGNTTDWLEKKIVEGIAKFNVKAVFIDHLHYIVDMKAMGANMSLQIGATMRELKRIALRWGIVIFLIAHITKSKIMDIPDLDAIRDSSFVAQEADIVMFIVRLRDKTTGEYSNEALASVQAHRRTGKCGTVKLVYLDNKFKELEGNYEPTSI